MKVCSRSKCSGEETNPVHSQGAQSLVRYLQTLSSFLCFSSKGLTENRETPKETNKTNKKINKTNKTSGQTTQEKKRLRQKLSMTGM